MVAIDQFLTELIREKFGETDLTDEMKNDIKAELTDRLNQYFTLRTIEIVSLANPEAVTQLSELIKTNPSPTEVQAFISQHVKDPDILIAQILADFRSLYLGVEQKKTN